MFVACPHCGFLVAALARTAQRCPRCGGAVDTSEAEPPESAAAAPATEAPATDDAEDAEHTDDAGDADAGDTGTIAGPGDPATGDGPAPAPAPAAPTRVRRSQRAPSFVRRHAPAPARSGDRRWWAIVVVLALALALQLLLAQRVELAGNARWRPVITRLCGVVRCAVPAWREPAAFSMLQRSVRPKPGAPGVLRVDAAFRNDARWAQPWPTLLLTLSDMEGRPVGQRAFQPREYRRGAGGGRIAPGQSVAIRFDVVEPAQSVVAFTFDFQ